MSAAEYTSYAFICRACLKAGYIGSETPLSNCPECKGGRLITHDELFHLNIAHIDCDAFYCSVEKRDNPALAKKPIIVGGGKRGVVAAACYVARQYGIRSAMPTWQAKKACPELIIIRPRMAIYQTVSRQIREMMQALTPLVQPLSIDEAFLDLSGTQKLHKASPAAALMRLQTEIKQKIGITVSVGLSYNKSLAKIASDQDKPDGFFIIGQKEAESWLQDKPINILSGMGKTGTAKMNQSGIYICRDLVNAPSHKLQALLGNDWLRLHNLAKGIDIRPVNIEGRVKSISSETTFVNNLADYDALVCIGEALSSTVSRRLKEQELAGIRIILKLKFANHRLITRSHSLSQPTQMAHVFFEAVCHLLKKETGIGKNYRLMGVSIELYDGVFSSENTAMPASLFDDAVNIKTERQNRLEAAIDMIHTKQGDNSLKTGRSFSGDYRGEHNKNKLGDKNDY